MLYTSFFFNDTAPTDIYTLSLHDALPILLLTPGTFGVYVMAREIARAGARMPLAFAETGTLPYLRSEEHTSELQSRGHLVCRLLLEKKKKSPNLCRYSLRYVVTTTSTVLA